MKTRIQPFKILSFTAIVFCAAATGAFAGQHFHTGSSGSSYSGHVNHANEHANMNAQVRTNTQMQANRNGASSRVSSTSVRTQSSYGTSNENAYKKGVLAQHQQEIRNHEVLGR